MSWQKGEDTTVSELEKSAACMSPLHRHIKQYLTKVSLRGDDVLVNFYIHRS